jgi:hypothetical protein
MEFIPQYSESNCNFISDEFQPLDYQLKFNSCQNDQLTYCSIKKIISQSEEIKNEKIEEFELTNLDDENSDDENSDDENSDDEQDSNNLPKISIDFDNKIIIIDSQKFSKEEIIQLLSKRGRKSNKNPDIKKIKTIIYSDKELTNFVYAEHLLHRREKNKIAARKSRVKKNLEFEMKDKLILELRHEILELKNKVKQLEKENIKLKKIY